jgi:hypothetical protein
MAITSPKELNKSLRRLLKENAELKRLAQKSGRAFFGLNEEQLLKKLRGETSHSPFFSASVIDQIGSPGSPGFLLTNYFNPDPFAYLCSTTIFFGLTMFASDIPSAVAARDPRWPCFSKEVTVLSPGQTAGSQFTFTVPLCPKGTYFCSALLWEWNSVHGFSKPLEIQGPMGMTVR